MNGGKFESYEKVDYGYVINMQLNRIAEIRSKLGGGVVGRYDSVGSYLVSVLNEYLFHVDTLSRILLPELRGDSEKYLVAAFRMGILEEELKDIENELKWETKKDEVDKEKVEELKKRRDEIEEQLKKIEEDYGIKSVLRLVDKALEEMLKKLNEANLLLRGKTVKVGTV